MRTVAALLIAVAACSDPAEPDTFDGYGEWTAEGLGDCPGNELVGHRYVTIIDTAIGWRDLSGIEIGHRGSAAGDCFHVDKPTASLSAYDVCPNGENGLIAVLTWNAGLAGECVAGIRLRAP